MPNVYNSLQSSFLSLAWPWPGRSLPKGNQWECWDHGLGPNVDRLPVNLPPLMPLHPLLAPWCPLHPWWPLMPWHPLLAPIPADAPTPLLSPQSLHSLPAPQFTPDTPTPCQPHDTQVPPTHLTAHLSPWCCLDLCWLLSPYNPYQPPNVPLTPLHLWQPLTPPTSPTSPQWLLIPYTSAGPSAPTLPASPQCTADTTYTPVSVGI